MEDVLLRSLAVTAQLKNYNDWIMGHLRGHLSGLLLDVGSGYGALAELYDSPVVDKIVLSDYSLRMTAVLRERFALRPSRYEVLDPCGIEDLVRLPRWERRRPDTIMALNVLEHIEDDQAALNALASLLLPGGMLLLMVPALPFLYGRIDESAGHFRRYTRKELAGKVKNAGLEVCQVYYMNFFGIIPWFMAGTMIRMRELALAPCVVLDRLVPVLRAMDFLARMSVGQSLILAARK